jgi:hypothetical protein
MDKGSPEKYVVLFGKEKTNEVSRSGSVKK